MKAIALTRYLPVTDPDCLQEFTLADPVPQARDLLISVEAISVNPVDTKVRAPKSQVEDAPKVLGWDACGVVKAVGPEVTLFKTGDRVYYAGDISRQGCNSELHCVDERIVGKQPGSLSAEEAAALPLTALTAWESLFDRMGIKQNVNNQGKTILIIGGAGGVGSMAIQLAHKIAGLKVIATASRNETSAWCEQMGADHVINHHRDIGSQLSEVGIPEVDYILCCNNTDTHFDAMVEVIKPQGAICCMVDAAGQLDMNALKAKSVRFAWEFMFTRPKFQTDDMIEQHRILDEVARLVDAGVLQTTLKQVLLPINAAKLREAHAIVEQGGMIGKLVLSQW